MIFPTPKRLAALAAGTTAALGAVADATYATGAPETVVATAVGIVAFGGAAVASAVRSRPQEVRR
jgi:hypothetical protein